jgi:formylglycine-generating enzyme required for sulfatase activity/serine/threonine protein kinase
MVNRDIVRDVLALLELLRSVERIDDSDLRARREHLLAELSPGDGEQVRQLLRSPTPPIGPSSFHTQRLPPGSTLDLGPGTVLGEKWKIVRELGRGGFSTVFEALDFSNHDRPVALKILDPSLHVHKHELIRFHDEIEHLRRLIHPRIVRLFDSYEDPERQLALYSMELVPGSSAAELAEVMRKTGSPTPIKLAVSILQQVMEALIAAHAFKVLHLDVTPSNILLAGGSAAELLLDPSCDPEVKLVDFGIAGSLDQHQLAVRSRALGTMAYVAPEILDLGARVTAAADIFGTGAVIYELLCGKPPIVTTYQPLDQLRPEIAQPLSSLLMSMIRARPEDRPSSSQIMGTLRSPGILQPLPPTIRSTSPGKTEDIIHKENFAPSSGAAMPAPPTRSGGAPETMLQPPAPPRIDYNKPLFLAGGAVVLIAVTIAVLQAIDGGRGSVMTPDGASTPASTAPPQHDSLVPRHAVYLGNQIWLNFRYLQPAELVMGSADSELSRDNDEPLHRVRLSRGYWIGETEVTQGQWQALMSNNPSHFSSCGSGCPVEQVSWYDAMSYANALSTWEGYEQCYQLNGCTERYGTSLICSEVTFNGQACTGYRLPTEAEWEHAARAGASTPFMTGENLHTDQANYDGNHPYAGHAKGAYLGQPVPVASYEQNRFGLFDAHGNVREWVQDCGERQQSRPPAYRERIVDPLCTRGALRVVRGGGWISYAEDCRFASRELLDPRSIDSSVGFRLVRSDTAQYQPR